MQVVGSPEALRTLIGLPLKSTFLLPGPMYVPSATTTSSPAIAALMAACMELY